MTTAHTRETRRRFFPALSARSPGILHSKPTREETGGTQLCFHVILFVLPKQRTPSFQKRRTSMLGVEIFFLIVVLILLSQRVNFFTSWLSHLKSKHWRKTNQLREDKKNSPRARSMARIVQIFLKIGSGTDIQRILTSLHVVRSFCRMFNLCKNSDYIVLNEHVHSSSYLFYFVAFFGNF